MIIIIFDSFGLDLAVLLQCPVLHKPVTVASFELNESLFGVAMDLLCMGTIYVTQRGIMFLVMGVL